MSSRQTGTEAAETFTYDFLDRLTNASGPSYANTNVYDQIGNITSMNGTNYTYGTKPQAVTMTGTTIGTSQDFAINEVQGLSFDGNDYVTVPGSQLTVGEGWPGVSDSATYEFWIKTTSSSGTQVIMNKGTIKPYLQNGYLNVAFSFCDSPPGTWDAQTNVFIADGSWHYVMAFVNTSGDTGVGVSVDGVDRVGNTFDLEHLNYTGSWPLYIGQAGGGSQFFVGQLDEIRISSYSRAGEAASAWAAGRGLLLDATNSVALFHMDDQASSLTDSSSTHANGTIVGATYTTGVNLLGTTLSTKSLLFTGTNYSRANIPSNDNLLRVGEPDTTSGASYEFWMRTSSSTGTQYLMDKGSIRSYVQNGILKCDFNYADSTTWTGSSGVNVADGLWHYIALTTDPSSSRVYIDGILKVSSTSNQRLKYTNTIYYLGLAGTYDGLSLFNGQLEEVRVSNSVRSATEITANWAQGYGRVLIADGNTVVLYHADGTLVDSSSNQRNGSTINAYFVNGLVFPSVAPANTLSISAPTLGKEWLAGSTQTITWNPQGVTGNLRIELLSNGIVVGLVASSVPASNGTYSWTIPTNQAAGCAYQLKFSSGVSDYTYDANGNMTSRPGPTSLGVSSVAVTNGGTGYTSLPSVTFSGGGGGSGTVATAALTPTTVGSLNVTNGGSGYTTAPSVTFTGGGGSGATATATLAGRTVTSVSITNGGTGYTSAPSVNLSGGGGTGATATAVLSSTSIANLTLTTGGSGYTSVPTVAFTGGGGTGAVATATLASAGVSNSFNLISGGSGYTSAPAVSITGGGGSGATADAVLTGRSVATIAVSNGGSGFTSAPTITVNNGGGSGAQATSTLAPTSVSSPLTLTNGGSGFTSSPSVTFSGGGGSGAAATTTLASGAVGSLNLGNGGSGYNSAPSVAFSGGGGSGAAATATLAGKTVASVTVNNQGHNYSSVPTVTLSGGGGSGATARATVSSQKVTAITVTNAGSGYTSTPSVSITGGGGSGATATANLSTTSIASLTLTNGGSGYTSAPNISFSGGSGSGAAATSTLASRAVASLTLTNGGSGYTSVPSITISGNGSGATATAILTGTQIATITVTAGGSGYTSTPSVGISGGGGSGAVANTTLSPAAVSGLTLTNAGTGYTSIPNVSFSNGGGSGAAATAVLAPAPVGSLTLTNGGTGYTSVPGATFNGGGGTGATATATMTGVSITSITVTNAGSGYTSVPNVDITGGGGNGAVAAATLAPGAVGSLTLTNGGTLYSSVPNVSFSGGNGSGATATAALSPTSVAGVSVGTGGSGYTSAPNVTISGGGGSGAMATSSTAPIASTQTLNWDSENRLISIVVGGTTITQYVYDGDGKRVKEIDGSTTTIYVNQYYEKNVTSGVATTSYFLGSKLVAQREGTTLRYVYQDSLGSTTMTTDGTTTSTVAYFPFGSIRSGTVPVDEKFTGQRLDSTGLYYYNARYYDPTIGRFVSPDATGSDLRDPQSLNRFSYVENNPLKYVDNTGHIKINWKTALKIVAVVAVAVVVTAAIVVAAPVALAAIADAATIVAATSSSVAISTAATAVATGVTAAAVAMEPIAATTAAIPILGTIATATAGVGLEYFGLKLNPPGAVGRWNIKTFEEGDYFQRSGNPSGNYGAPVGQSADASALFPNAEEMPLHVYQFNSPWNAIQSTVKPQRDWGRGGLG